MRAFFCFYSFDFSREPFRHVPDNDSVAGYFARPLTNFKDRAPVSKLAKTRADVVIVLSVFPTHGVKEFVCSARAVVEKCEIGFEFQFRK